ncbi:hypothetical protein [Azospirillum halopraeferens]|uniref:hypothetical protein n=1 Tax=Azospirillum halopraeferens TaxID=34010 RepID=UPI0003F4EE57|nr:hypothetical protein [Azospirillum halopraeferens]
MSRPAAPPSPPPPAALVAFSGAAELWWLRLLRPGFRHCFVVVNDGRHWVLLDPLAPFTDVAVLEVDAAFDLAGWLRARGMAVVPARPRRGLTRPAPWAPFTCVEAVKRVLGLHAPLVVTPWQLYRHLVRERLPA